MARAYTGPFTPLGAVAFGVFLGLFVALLLGVAGTAMGLPLDGVHASAYAAVGFVTSVAAARGFLLKS